MIGKFGKWDSDIHNDPEQQKRISASASIRDSDVVINENDCKISGSEAVPYIVTLNSCSCRDFISRKKPCKHIYYLAVKKGHIDCNTVDLCKSIFPYTPSHHSKECKGINAAALKELENLSDTAQRELHRYLYEHIYHNAEKQKIDSEQSVLFKKCDLVIITEATFNENLSYMKISEVQEIVRKVGKKPPTKLKKSDLIEWCKENAPEIESLVPKFFHLDFSEDYKTAHRKLYNILNNKFFPKGSIIGF